MDYNPKEIEPKWQAKWRKEGTYEPDLDKAQRPFFNLMMFPYPSAEGLHVGNMYAFTGSDIYGRMKRMQGHDVFEPIGLDGFGIHSENYALKMGTHPMDQAAASEGRFYGQLEKIGNGFAWNERLETYKPEYYKWTQWIFAEMFRRGLAYRKKQLVNWCPKDLTVLADEQVENGKCERCGTEVVKRELEQWFFGITKYADRLLANIDALDWSEKVKIAQRNWIGKSEGAEISFFLDFKKNPKHNEWRGSNGERASLKVFTTRPDTLFGATYLVLSPEHLWVTLATDDGHDVLSNREEVRKYVTAAKGKSEMERLSEGKEKTGVELKGVVAINPANGEEIPIWVADYVLGSYGTGAIMAVPAHDERDFDFANRFGLPMKVVIEPETGKVLPGEKMRKSIVAIVEDPKTGKFLTLDWGPKMGGMLFIGGGREEGEDEIATAVREIKEETGYADIRFVAKTEVMHHHYFAFAKNVARSIEVVGLRFQLVSDENGGQQLEEQEKGNFKIEWLTRDEVLAVVKDENHLLSFKRLVLGGIYEGFGKLTGSGKFDGMDSEAAKWEITKFVGGERKAAFRLRDWLISRQRYWGPPIPMIFCEACAEKMRGERDDMPGWYAVADKDLPVLLPRVENFRPTGSGASPLAAEKSFHEVACPKCGATARRETDVSDTFLDSAWYYLRYLSDRREAAGDGENDVPFDEDRVKKWLPAEGLPLKDFSSRDPEIPGEARSDDEAVSAPAIRRGGMAKPQLEFQDRSRKEISVAGSGMYIGGAEHAVLHLLYVRFVAMVLHDWRLIKFEEPFKKFRAHGLVIKDGAKMSKSKGNVINPDDYIANFGADTLRMCLMFLAPFEQGGDFREAGVLGTERFLKRVWQMANGKWQMGEPERSVTILLHKTIKKVTDDIEHLHYNTSVSALMILFRAFEEEAQMANGPSTRLGTGKWQMEFEAFLKLLAPFAPHITEEIWRETLGHETSIHREPWPVFDPALIKDETFTLVFQVNSRTRGTMEVSADITEDEAKAAALADQGVKSALAGKELKKIIYVEKKLVNIVA